MRQRVCDAFFIDALVLKFLYVLKLALDCEENVQIVMHTLNMLVHNADIHIEVRYVDYVISLALVAFAKYPNVPRIHLYVKGILEYFLKSKKAFFKEKQSDLQFLMLNSLAQEPEFRDLVAPLKQNLYQNSFDIENAFIHLA